MAKRKDGTEFPVELDLAQITTVWDDEFFCDFLRDIRRQKYDLDELTEKERLTFGLLEVSCYPLFAIDGSQRIFLASSATSKHLGWSKDEIFA
jgi:PAS domain-containing protein